MPSDGWLIDPSGVGALAFAVAFLAGLLSFLSPCVLPLVPAYIGYLSGATVGEQGVEPDPRRTFSHAVAFVAGFGLLFLAFGAGIYIIEAALGVSLQAETFTLQDLLVRVGAVLLAAMAARAADATLDGPWRIRIGGRELRWPAHAAGLDQRYVRWALVGLTAALIYGWLSIAPPAVRLLDALMLVLVPLVGADLDERAALAVGVGVAALNTASRALAPVASAYGPIDWIGVALQAVLIAAVVLFLSQTTVFYQDRRPSVSSRLQDRGYLTSGVMGAVFGAGWTPCTGPNLAVILALAAAAGTTLLGAALLTTYTLGLGLPFIAVGLAFGAATRALRRLKPHLGKIKAVNTLLLLFMAALILSGALTLLAGYGSFVDEWLGLPTL